MIDKVGYGYFGIAILLFSSYSAIIYKNGSNKKFMPKSIMSIWTLVSVICFFVILGITNAYSSGVPPAPPTLIVLLVCLLTSCISSCIVYLASL